MYTGNTKNVIAVWVFTYHDDGTLNVTQSTPDREKFKETRDGVKKLGQWVRETMRDQNKCPYSPQCPDIVNDDEANPSLMTEGK